MKIIISLPNEGEYDVEDTTPLLKNFNVEKLIGDTYFCENDGGYFSIKKDQYDKLDIEKCYCGNPVDNSNSDCVHFQLCRDHSKDA